MKDIFCNISPKSFDTLFSTDEKCLEFLSNEKWKDGFTCRKCGHDHFSKGKTPFSRKCTRCKHEESATAYTIFHRCRIPIRDAFHIGYMVCNDPEISTYEISRRLELRQMTSWKFKKRFLECIETEGSFLDVQLHDPSQSAD